MILTCIIVFFTTLVLALFSVKKVIYISNKKHLFDEPSEERKIHKTRTPNLGGLAIYASLLLVLFIFLPGSLLTDLKYIIASSFIIVGLGLVDDLVGVKPIKKLLIQIGVALFTALSGAAYFSSFYGFLGLTEVPYAVSILVSVLFIVLLINAFNLIDGINCLAGGIGLLICLTFACLFWRMQEPGLVIFAIAMCGCLTAFLFYNRTPAKVFMGDTGSMLLGFVVSILSIRFAELTESAAVESSFADLSAPAILFGLLIIPLFDTLRVFILRILKKKSPFSADRGHLHHRLLDLNLSHLQATGILLTVTLASILFVLLFSAIAPWIQFAGIFTFILLFNSVVELAYKRQINKPRKITYENSSFTIEKLLTAENISSEVNMLNPIGDTNAIVINMKKPSPKTQISVQH